MSEVKHHMPLLRRHCPKCGTKVSWVRLWLKPWIFARWPCTGCGAVLRFDWGRRLVVALLIGLVTIIASSAGIYLAELWGLPPFGVAFTAMILLWIPVMLLDAVTLA